MKHIYILHLNIKYIKSTVFQHTFRFLYFEEKETKKKLMKFIASSCDRLTLNV
jgi:hypothetical protein